MSPDPPLSAVPVYLLNPDVSQSTIGATVCVSGWTATVRPPASYTTALKVRQLAGRGYPDQNTADYEEDHLIPLELGGSPREERNLWPELWPQARTKDADETALKRDVCAGRKTLGAARSEMWLKWGGYAR